MKLFRRLWGLIIIIRALLPIALVLATYLIAKQIAAEVRSALAPSISEITARVERMQRTVDETRQTIGRVNGEISAMVQTAEGINERLQVDLGNVTEAMGIQPFRLADKIAELLGLTINPSLITRSIDLSKTFDVLGLGQVKEVFAQIASIFQELADLNGVSSLGEDVSAIITQMRVIIKLLLGILYKWARILRLSGSLVLVLLLLSYLEHVVRSLRRGWMLLRGLPDPGR